MPDVLDPQIKDTLAIENAKTIAGGSAFATNLALQGFAQAASLAAQNAVQTQQQMNQVGVNAATLGTKNMHEMDAVQAHSLAKLGGSDNANVIAQLGSVVAALQQIVKTAQTTPPVTGGQ